MRKRLTVLAALAAMSTGMIAAQAPGRRPGPRPGVARGTPPTPEQMQDRHIERLATMLSLSDAQKTQAKAFFSTAAEQAAALHPQLESAGTGLREAVKGNNPAAIDSHAAELGRLTGQMRAIHAKASAQFYSILTAEQRETYDKRVGGRGMGPGMMGPGPMGHGPMRHSPMRRGASL